MAPDELGQLVGHHLCKLCTIFFLEALLSISYIAELCSAVIILEYDYDTPIISSREFFT